MRFRCPWICTEPSDPFTAQCLQVQATEIVPVAGDLSQRTFLQKGQPDAYTVPSIVPLSGGYRDPYRQLRRRRRLLHPLPVPVGPVALISMVIPWLPPSKHDILRSKEHPMTLPCSVCAAQGPKGCQPLPHSLSSEGSDMHGFIRSRFFRSVLAG